MGTSIGKIIWLASTHVAKVIAHVGSFFAAKLLKVRIDFRLNGELELKAHMKLQLLKISKVFLLSTILFWLGAY